MVYDVEVEALDKSVSNVLNRFMLQANLEPPYDLPFFDSLRTGGSSSDFWRYRHLERTAPRAKVDVFFR